MIAHDRMSSSKSDRFPAAALAALLSGVLPIAAAHGAYLLNVYSSSELAAEFICMPYLDGCVSISRAARSGPGLTPFRWVMLASVPLLLLTWWSARRWLGSLRLGASVGQHVGKGRAKDRRASAMAALGMIGAVFTSDGHLLAFPLSDVPELAKGKGNKLINIPPKRLKSGEETVVGLVVVSEKRRDPGVGRPTLPAHGRKGYRPLPRRARPARPRGFARVTKVKLAKTVQANPVGTIRPEPAPQAGGIVHFLTRVLILPWAILAHWWGT